MNISPTKEETYNTDSLRVGGILDLQVNTYISKHKIIPSLKG